jgi:hypothetical protein
MHAAPGSTLADVPVLLTSRERQAELASQIEDSVLSPFWEWYGQRRASDALERDGGAQPTNAETPHEHRQSAPMMPPPGVEPGSTA